MHVTTLETTGAADTERRAALSRDPERCSVAVVGGGIAGLTAAYLLSRRHRVTLFEAQDRVGGHAHTHDVPLTTGVPAAVDSGFIVLNDRTYPLLRRLFAELGVRTRPTEMSMSIVCDGCGLAFKGGTGPRGILAQRRRAADPRFWRLLLEVRRFQRLALTLLEGPEDDASYGEFLHRHRFDRRFVSHYALPVVSCVWSMGHEQALGYPAAYLFGFLRNHGFLSLRDAPTWHTVVGGSRTYVELVTHRLDEVRRGAPVTSVTRTPEGVVLETGGAWLRFDRAVVATHADEALGLLADASPLEKEVLGAFEYSRNQVLLHRDAGALPRLGRARASWNYRLADCAAPADRARVSYWMNRLQGHPEDEPLVVTLNPVVGEEPLDVVASMTYEHPIYTGASVAAQRRLPSLNTDRLAFAGAYHGWGFHEDGCRSGVEAAAALGVTW